VVSHSMHNHLSFWFMDVTNASGKNERLMCLEVYITLHRIGNLPL